MSNLNSVAKVNVIAEEVSTPPIVVVAAATVPPLSMPSEPVEMVEEKVLLLLGAV